ncbi:2-amino-4-hydroxy-6-hydroxymethyldihydropteridine diphosphokinase [Breznakiellaceae bacterium SP9]
MTHIAYIALGSNIGDKEQYLTSALTLLTAENTLQITAVSKMYKTAPVGYTEQDFFLNMVCRIETSLDPYQLLEVLHKIEDALQRKRTIRWGARTIDLDILLYDEIRSDDPLLTIPTRE